MELKQFAIFCMVVVMLALGAVAITSCSVAEDTINSHDVGDGFRVWTDTVTGCDYVRAYSSNSGDIALTPRLNPDGTPFCRAR